MKGRAARMSMEHERRREWAEAATATLWASQIGLVSDVRSARKLGGCFVHLIRIRPWNAVPEFKCRKFRTGASAIWSIKYGYNLTGCLGSYF